MTRLIATGLLVGLWLCTHSNPALAASSAKKWSAGAFASAPKDNRFGLAAGVGMNSGLALGIGWTGKFLGLEMMAGYQPTYQLLYPPSRACSPSSFLPCVRFGDLPNGVRVEQGAAFAADLLVPLLCDRHACVGLKGGFRTSSLLGHGAGGSLYVQGKSSTWMSVAAAVGVSVYPLGGGRLPLFVSIGNAHERGSNAVGLEVTFTLAPWRVGREDA